MDNICHTLVGAVCGEAGLKHRSRLGTATLMIAANLPDIDVAVFATGASSVAFRRGLTHGVAAQALLPPLLAFVMWMIARRSVGRAGPPPHLGWLTALSYIGVLSHVGLDFLNTYGVRLLMPLSGHWFYGDTLFIIDPWMWAVMGSGLWLARRSSTPRPARAALLMTFAYVFIMFIGARAARQIVMDGWKSEHGSAPMALMVGPRPIQPFTRDIIVDAGDRYVTGTFSWVPLDVRFDEVPVPKHQDDPAVTFARQDQAVRDFLIWSRFPVWALAREPDGVGVSVGDLRFAGRGLPGGARFQAGTIVRQTN